jgi:capsular polysaccharide export protein
MKKIYFLGISRWKQRRLKPFFPNNQLVFVNSVNGLDCVTVWGNRKLEGLTVQRIEDGFIRSVSLGVDFSQPYSLILDKKSIYFDATKESDLEYILSNYEFNEELLNRANKVKNYLVENKLSKYNLYKDAKIELNKKDVSQKTILVIGQVEGDASLVYGADNMKNIELLKSSREDNHEAYIVYKPHPDVLNGNRVGNIEDDIALKYCDSIEKKVSVDSLLEIVDEVHTMTSLVGFEALLRDKKVVCYGLPFYAGWGLTVDKRRCERRERKLTLSQLIAGTYILYPRYIDPITLELCEIERVLESLTHEKEDYHNSLVYRTKIKVKNFVYKKYYALLRHLLKD